MNNKRVVRLAQVAQAIGQSIGAHAVAVVAIENGVAADAAFALSPAFNKRGKPDLVSALRQLADDIESGRNGPRVPFARCTHESMRRLPLGASQVCDDCHAMITGAVPPEVGERWRMLQSSDVWTVVEVRPLKGGVPGDYMVKLELGPAEDELEPTHRETHSDRFHYEWERVP